MGVYSVTECGCVQCEGVWVGGCVQCDGVWVCTHCEGVWVGVYSVTEEGGKWEVCMRENVGAHRLLLFIVVAPGFLKLYTLS